MERVNHEGNVHGTVHWEANGYASYGRASGAIDFSQYHVYSIEWDANYIRWFVDGVQFNEILIQNGTGNTEEFQEPFFILLNMAVGGNWPGAPNASTPFPSQMLVDYVRVYQQTNSSSIVGGGYYKLVNKASGLVMDVSNSSTDDGAVVQQWTDNGTDAQKWLLTRIQ